MQGFHTFQANETLLSNTGFPEAHRVMLQYGTVPYGIV